MTEYVKCVVYIRDNATGEIVVDDGESVCPRDETTGKLSPFWWTSDGNAGCDCNRRIFFFAAKGIDIHEDEGDEEDEDYVDPAPCGKGSFSVKLVEPASGEVIYDEFSNPLVAETGEGK